MSLAGLMVHDVTIVTANVTESRYGDDLKEWVAARRVETKGWVSQRDATEILGDREAQLSDWIVYLPVGTTISAADRVEWEGTTFEVVGVPNRAWTPRGPHHLEARLSVVTG
jgi:head-tail adaptor